MKLEKMVLVTHSGVFHADDVLAVAILSQVFELEVVRSRNSSEIDKGDLVVDVGGAYNPLHGRFDHHQKGGAGTRENGVPFASAGLVWAYYGKDVLKKVLGGSSELIDLSKLVGLVDINLICGVDARDNGIKTHYGLNGAEVYSFSDIISAFNPSWNQVQNFGSFFSAVELAKTVLVNEIKRQASSLLAEVEIAKMLGGQLSEKVLVFDKYVPWAGIVPGMAPQALYVIFPDPSGDWRVQATPVGTGKESFELKAPLPEKWRGKTGKELAEETGFSDAVFCHNSGFIMGTKTRDSAIYCAELAVRMREVENNLC